MLQIFDYVGNKVVPGDMNANVENTMGKEGKFTYLVNRHFCNMPKDKFCGIYIQPATSNFLEIVCQDEKLRTTECIFSSAVRFCFHQGVVSVTQPQLGVHLPE